MTRQTLVHTKQIRSTVSTRFRKLELLPTSDRALMHSGISVIAQCSHERRINLPNDNGHPFAEAQRRDPGVVPALSLVWFTSSLPRAILILPRHSDGPRVLRDPFPFWLSLQLYGSSSPSPSHSLVHCIPLCSNYEKECSFGTRQGIHNGQQPLETIIDPRILV